MWKQIIKLNFCDLKSITSRAYLTEAYKLNSEWDQRLKTPILEKVNIEKLFVDLNQKFSQRRKINWIDVDIFANKATENNVEDALDLVKMLRSTAEAYKMLDSTQHAVIRLLTSNPEHLLALLNQRLQFGVFLDHHQANLLLDKYIKDNNFMVAARLATFQMLQEDFENEITRYLSLLACYKFVDKLETFVDLIPPPPPEITVPEVAGKKKKIEEIKVRVKYLRNPYFDDHFDITDTNHLVGKTLLYLADEVGGVDEVLANSVRLLGFALYQKYEDGIAFISEKKVFYSEVVEKVKSLAENVDDNGKKFFDEVNGISNLKESKVETIIEELIKKAVQENEAKEIEDQKKVYSQWIEERESKLNAEIARLDRIKRLEDIEKIQEGLVEKERKLWFFENEDQLELQIQNKTKTYHPQRWFGKKKKPRKIDENYVPPDIDSIKRERRE